MINRDHWEFSSATTGTAYSKITGTGTYQAEVAGTGAVTATVIIEARNGVGLWVTLATITLTGTTSISDVAAVQTHWAEHRARCTAITGTSALLKVDYFGKEV